MKVKLGDIFEVGSGGTPSKLHPEYYNGNIPWIKTGDLKEKNIYEVESFITEEGVKNSSAKMYDPNTVLIAMYGATIGAVSIMKIRACTNQACAAFKKSDYVLPEYLYYFLKSQKEKFIKDGVGGAQPNISAGYLKKIEMEVPLIKDQEKVVTLLNIVGNLIEKHREQIEHLENLIKSRFVEMFGNENHMDKWPCCKIGNVADVSVGVVIKPAQYYTDDITVGIPAFRSLNIGEMYIKDSEWVYFTPEGNEKNKKSSLQENDLVIVRSGAPGTACVITKQFSGYNAIDIIIARPDPNKVNSVFMCAFTNFPHGKKQIEAGTGGAAQQHFNVGKYKDMTLILPPIEMQKQYADFVTKINKSKAVIKKSLDETQLLFDSLMQKYFG